MITSEDTTKPDTHRQETSDSEPISVSKDLEPTPEHPPPYNPADGPSTAGAQAPPSPEPKKPPKKPATNFYTTRRGSIPILESFIVDTTLPMPEDLLHNDSDKENKKTKDKDKDKDVVNALVEGMRPNLDLESNYSITSDIWLMRGHTITHTPGDEKYDRAFIKLKSKHGSVDVNMVCSNAPMIY